MRPIRLIPQIAFWFFLPFCFSASYLSRGFYIEVPFVPQVGNYCGPAALSMVFSYWGHPVDQHQLAHCFQPFPIRGLSGAQLKELAAREGFSAYSFSGQSDVLVDHLRKGRPLILALRPSRLSPFNHFVVLVGWDASKQEWIVHDPASGAYLRRSAQSLARQWQRLQKWTLLVVPNTAAQGTKEILNGKPQQILPHRIESLEEQ